jgi:RHS repeat-associated protein
MVEVNKYNKFGLLVENTNINGNKIQIEYDENFNVTKEINTLSGVKKFNYYDKSNLLVEVKRNFESASPYLAYTRDDLGNITSEKDADDVEMRYEYSEEGCNCSVNENIKRAIDGNGHITEFKHNWRGQVVEQKSAKGNFIRNKFDARGNKKRVTVYDAKNTVETDYNLIYDSINNLSSVSEKIPVLDTYKTSYPTPYLLGPVKSYWYYQTYYYDKAGNNLGVRKSGGDSYSDIMAVENKYNNYNKLVEKNLWLEEYYKKYTLIDKVEYSYDKMFNVTKVSNIHSNLEFEYDKANRQTRASTIKDLANDKRQPNSSLRFTYNKGTRISNLRNNNSHVQTFGRDEIGRLGKVLISGTGNKSLGEINRGFDEYSRVDEVALTNSLKMNMDYTNADRLRSVKTGNKLFSTLDYGRSGNIRTKETNLYSANFSYDQENQVIDARFKGRFEDLNEQFIWNASGNKLNGKALRTLYSQSSSNKAEKPYIVNGRVLEDAFDSTTQYGVGKYSYAYNIRGEVSVIIDNETKKKRVFSYDPEGKLIKIILADISSWSGGKIYQTVNFRYDGLGRRIEKEVIGESGELSRNHYVYFKENLLYKFDKFYNEVNKYILQDGIDNQYGFVKDDKVYFFHRDHLGSVTGILNEAGETLFEIKYSIFGKIEKVLRGSSEEVSVDTLISETGSEYFFTGREYDSEVGLYFYRARYYNPAQGRFLTSDPLGLEGGDTNFYRYVSNNPINFNDPLGMFQCSPYEGQGGGGAVSGDILAKTSVALAVGFTATVATGAAAISAAPAVASGVAKLLNNRYVRVGEGKFPEPYSKRVSIGKHKNKKFEIGRSKSGRIDVKLGKIRKTIRKSQ